MGPRITDQPKSTGLRQPSTQSGSLFRIKKRCAFALYVSSSGIRWKIRPASLQAVSEPTRRSFGTRMIISLGQQFKGKVDLDYRPGGVVYLLDVPIEALITKPNSPASAAAA